MAELGQLSCRPTSSSRTTSGALGVPTPSARWQGDLQARRTHLCAPSDPEPLGQTSALADRLFHQEMGGLRTGEIRHRAAIPTDTETPAGIVE
jgi:hypothetical protein